MISEIKVLDQGFVKLVNVMGDDKATGNKGNEVQDLEKAAWYINREIARIKKGQEDA